MKFIQLLGLAAILSFASSCKSSSNEVSVNDNQVVLTEGLYAKMSTTQGDILIRLYYDATPMTVGSFVSLAEGTNQLTKVKPGEPYFNGLTFHRVIADFMIQGGDPQGNGGGGPGYQFPDEFVDTLKHTSSGILSMANAGPGTNGSQFFITDTATGFLDNKHTVFGKVVKGMSVVRAIARVDKRAGDKPVTDVVIDSVRIIRVGSDARKFDAFAALEDGMAQAELDKAAAKEARAEDAQAFLDTYTWLQDGVSSEEQFKGLYAEWTSQMQTTPSGLGYIVLEEGSGPQVEANEFVIVDYTGYLAENGKFFDSSYETIAMAIGSYDPRRPYEGFQIMSGPSGRVIEGWKEGIMLFKKGTKARLIIPPSLGYGAQGAGGVIPPNATLVFDINIAE